MHAPKHALLYSALEHICSLRRTHSDQLMTDRRRGAMHVSNQSMIDRRTNNRTSDVPRQYQAITDSTHSQIPLQGVTPYKLRWTMHKQTCALSQTRPGSYTDMHHMQGTLSVPFIGNVGVASIQQNGFGRLARDLALCGVVEEVTHHLPEEGAIRIALLEVKRSWTCTGSVAPASTTHTHTHVHAHTHTHTHDM